MPIAEDVDPGRQLGERRPFREREQMSAVPEDRRHLWPARLDVGHDVLLTDRSAMPHTTGGPIFCRLQTPA